MTVVNNNNKFTISSSNGMVATMTLSLTPLWLWNENHTHLSAPLSSTFSWLPLGIEVLLSQFIFLSLISLLFCCIFFCFRDKDLESTFILTSVFIILILRNESTKNSFTLLSRRDACDTEEHRLPKQVWSQLSLRHMQLGSPYVLWINIMFCKAEFLYL